MQVDKDETIQNSIEMHWKPKSLDLGLSVGITLLFPFFVQLLFFSIGALIPMFIYYGIAWGLFKWRRGSTGYFNPFKTKLPITFLINVGVSILSCIFTYFDHHEYIDFNMVGVLVTSLIWAPINAASEQLLWIYIFESWDLFPIESVTGKKKCKFIVENFIYKSGQYIKFTIS